MRWLSKMGAFSQMSALSQMIDTHHQMLLRGAAGLTPESSAAIYLEPAGRGTSTARARTDAPSAPGLRR